MLASFQFGQTIDETHLAELKDRLKEIASGTYMIVGFIHFQFGNIPARGATDKMAPFQKNIWKCLSAHNIDYVNPATPSSQGVVDPSMNGHLGLVNRSEYPLRQGIRIRQRQKEKGPGEKPKKDNPTMRLVLSWSRAFESQFGIKYDSKKSDWSASKRLIKSTGRTVDEIVDVARKAWQKPKTFWNCFSRTRDLTDFCSAWNKIRTEISQTQNVETTTKKPVRSGVSMDF